jgi:hypothetical protein
MTQLTDCGGYMATRAERLTVERRAGERRSNIYPIAALPGVEGLRVSWGGIWAGVLAATAVLVLLTALGVAVGATAVDPGSGDSATMGIGAGIWAGLTLLAALFVGGLVSTRVGAIFDSTTSVFQGALVWVVSVLLLAYLAASGITMVAGGALRLVGGVGAAVGAVAAGQEGDVAAGTVDQILARLKDPQTAQRIASATGIPQADVQATLADTAQRVEASRDRPAAAAAEARNGVARLYEQTRASGQLSKKAAEMQPAARRTAWIAFGALVLSLLAAVLGAAAGRRRNIPRSSQPETITP